MAQFHGYCATDLGPGQIVERISDADTGALSRQIARSVADVALDDLLAAVATFFVKTGQSRMVFRDLHLGNLLVKRDAQGQIDRIVCVDGLSDFTFIKLRKLSNLAYQKWLKSAEEKVCAEVRALYAVQNQAAKIAA